MILRAENIFVDYGRLEVLKGISFELERGKIYSIIGPNGSGKSTLIRAICKSHRMKEGRVYLDDQDMRLMKGRAIAKKVAVLHQTHSRFTDVTVERLVSMGRYAHHSLFSKDRAEDERICRWAMEESNVLAMKDRRLQELSGGETQRAWFAAAIAQKPELLILDEPTTYLDINHQLELLEGIRRLNQKEGMTILMVLHDINYAARYSDEVMILKDGRLYQKGMPKETITEESIREVFGVISDITWDAIYGCPVFYPRNAAGGTI